MCVISFKTLTAAQRAKGVLSTHGIYAVVGSLDPNLTKRGCSYALSIPSDLCGKAVKILDSRNIAYGSVFS